MSAEHQLQNAYKEWRRLAKAEGDAIRARNWLVVADCQSALQRLQPEIIRHTESAQAEWSCGGVDRAAREKDFRVLVSELIEIEWRNNALLDTARLLAQSQLAELEKARTSLRRIHRCYTAPRRTDWNSLS